MTNGQPSPPRSRVVDTRLFSFLLELETSKSRRLRYPVSVICLTPSVSLAAATTIPPLAEQIASAIRATDVVTSLADSIFALLLVDAETFSLPSIFHRVIQLLNVGGAATEGQIVTWHAGGGCHPLTASTPAELMRQSLDLMAAARTQPESSLYLP